MTPLRLRRIMAWVSLAAAAATWTLGWGYAAMVLSITALFGFIHYDHE